MSLMEARPRMNRLLNRTTPLLDCLRGDGDGCRCTALIDWATTCTRLSSDSGSSRQGVGVGTQEGRYTPTPTIDPSTVSVNVWGYGSTSGSCLNCFSSIVVFSTWCLVMRTDRDEVMQSTPLPHPSVNELGGAGRRLRRCVEDANDTVDSLAMLDVNWMRSIYHTSGLRNRHGCICGEERVRGVCAGSAEHQYAHDARREMDARGGSHRDYKTYTSHPPPRLPVVTHR
ncbi:hypothetical protein ARMGADRAFT_1091439 [Armillaria gallica]|uniref:Uncharacterized protein n=1 Tax=Armillaria gallica TaxID=47427 RepID=A0A2H3CE04_ARMGA|nr:hypothetical protein ARMGADRAFT_1091439 [Armillaria gallica]